jgi:hypothetical protein
MTKKDRPDVLVAAAAGDRDSRTMVRASQRVWRGINSGTSVCSGCDRQLGSDVAM